MLISLGSITKSSSEVKFGAGKLIDSTCPTGKSLDLFSLSYNYSQKKTQAYSNMIHSSNHDFNFAPCDGKGKSSEIKHTLSLICPTALDSKIEKYSARYLPSVRI
jgi:hypothetical protein